MKYIFEVTIKPGRSIEEYAKTWTEESEIIQKEPGACGTRLHRVIGQENRLIAIASWESKEQRDAAIRKLESDEQFKALRAKHGGIVDFHLIGEIEEPEWVVLPEHLR